MVVLAPLSPAAAQPGDQRTDPPERELVLIPQWIPQAQFAGFYVALEKSLYVDADVPVQILDGGPGRPPSQLLAERRADCGTLFLADALRQHEQLVHVAQLVQRSSLMLVARRSSGITSPQDLNGRKVSLWGAEYQIQPLAFFRKFNIQPEVIPQSVTLNLFLRGGVDAASAMWHNEYHLLLNSGLDPEDLTVFFYHEYGLNFPEDGIYCRRDVWQNEPERVCRFVRATLAGWRMAFEDPEAALDIVMKYADAADTGTNRVHQRWMLLRMKDLMLPDSEGFGRLAEEDYQRVAAELIGAGLIPAAPPFESFYGSCR